MDHAVVHWESYPLLVITVLTAGKPLLTTGKRVRRTSAAREHTDFSTLLQSRLCRCRSGKHAGGSTQGRYPFPSGLHIFRSARDLALVRGLEAGFPGVVDVVGGRGGRVEHAREDDEVARRQAREVLRVDDPDLLEAVREARSSRPGARSRRPSPGRTRGRRCSRLPRATGDGRSASGLRGRRRGRRCRGGRTVGASGVVCAGRRTTCASRTRVATTVSVFPPRATTTAARAPIVPRRTARAPATPSRRGARCGVSRDRNVPVDPSGSPQSRQYPWPAASRCRSAGRRLRSRGRGAAGRGCPQLAQNRAPAYCGEPQDGQRTRGAERDDRALRRRSTSRIRSSSETISAACSWRTSCRKLSRRYISRTRPPRSRTR